MVNFKLKEILLQLLDIATAKLAQPFLGTKDMEKPEAILEILTSTAVEHPIQY